LSLVIFSESKFPRNAQHCLCNSLFLLILLFPQVPGYLEDRFKQHQLQVSEKCWYWRSVWLHVSPLFRTWWFLLNLCPYVPLKTSSITVMPNSENFKICIKCRHFLYRSKKNRKKSWLCWRNTSGFVNINVSDICPQVFTFFILTIFDRGRSY